jgi:flagellar protein FlaJ
MIDISVLPEFRDIYDESGIIWPFSNYIKKMTISIAIVFAITALFSISFYGIYNSLPMYKLILVTFSLSLITTNITAFLFLVYPLYIRNQLQGSIENSLIYSLSYMKIIATSGGSLDYIMERVADVEENQKIRQLARKYVTNTKLLGFDVSQAIEHVTRRTPSKKLKKLLEDISHNIRTSGDLLTLFKYETNRMLVKKREDLKKLILSLTYIGEVYVALFVLGPILFILIIIIMSTFVAGSTSSITQLNLVVFFGLPLLASMPLVVLDTPLEGDI